MFECYEVVTVSFEICFGIPCASLTKRINNINRDNHYLLYIEMERNRMEVGATEVPNCSNSSEILCLLFSSSASNTILIIRDFDTAKIMTTVNLTY